MQTIWKFPIIVDDYFEVTMPVEAEVLSVQTQGGLPVMWASVDSEADVETRGFCLRGTGHPLDGDEGRFVGSFQLHGGSLVFHLFEVSREALRNG